MRPEIYVSAVKEGVAVITLSGEMDFYYSPRLLKEIYTFVEKERPFIVLDLSGLDYLDIRVVRLIIEAQEIFLEIGGDIRLVSLRHSVAKLMRLTKFD
ncbi:STAS domain-containing protein [Nitrospinae bacterium AH-259-F20]|nr:STAS domain-containing protein [Nitrospinae bacterium AH-259-F20]